MTIHSNSPKIEDPLTERVIRNLQEQIQKLQSQLLQIQKAVGNLEANLHHAAGRYVATCAGCQTRFDMLAHHYSIGLFDNLVYVKCPKCQKTFPIKGGSGGEIRLVPD